MAQSKVSTATHSLHSVSSLITGSSEPNTAIKIFDGAHFIGETTAATDGKWSFPWSGGVTSSHPDLRAFGPHGKSVSCAHFEHYRHHDHASPINPAAPSIAGISNVTRSFGTSHHTVSAIDVALPTIVGFGHAGDVISVFDGITQIGSTAVHADGTWTFSTPTLMNGQHDFSVSTANGVTSNHLAVHVWSESAPVALAVATITSALDEFIDPAGNHHDNLIQQGGKTFDTSPKLLGTLDAALNTGETIVVYRDSVKLGIADVSGLGWSFQDTGVSTGAHIYSARVESATGAQGAESASFGIVEGMPGGLDAFPMLMTDQFLIFDTRGISRVTSDGKPMSFDLLEGVKLLEAHGATVKSYTDKDGFISIEVDWMSLLKTQPPQFDAFDFVAHRHVDNDKGGIDSYNFVGTLIGTPYSNTLNKWVSMSGAEDSLMQPVTPPVAMFITGIYDVIADESGGTVQSLIPNGGTTASSTHKIMFAFSGPVPQGWTYETWQVYRDGDPLYAKGQTREGGYDQATNTAWVIDTDVPPGPHIYTARIERPYGAQGAWSENYSILEATPPTAVATITNALDEFIDPNGVHHDIIVQQGERTSDTSPQLHGTISQALHEGESLVVYRDGQQIGTASVAGLGWSYQDSGLSTGAHVYTAKVIGALGEQGVLSDEFSIIETAGTAYGSLQFLATEDFLIFDTRFMERTTPAGKAIHVDLLEGVRMLEKAGMTVKSYTDNDGVISIEVDWIAYVATHPAAYFDLLLHRHIDNDQGGVNYYNPIAVPDFAILLNLVGTWRQGFFVIDAVGESPTPPANATITGVFDSFIDTDGHAHLTLVPAGGRSLETSHRIEGNLSEPMNKWSDQLVIYRDGEKLAGDNHAFSSLSDYSNTTWWIVDNDAPPGMHVYTARVERAFEAQGSWSPEYAIQESAPAPTQDSLTARMLMNDNLLTVDTGMVSHLLSDGSISSIDVKAELTLAGVTVAVYESTVDINGIAVFEADWSRIIAANPNATLTLTAHDNVNQSNQIVDKHATETLASQFGHWINATPDGESAAFFNADDRSIHIHGNAAINTITISDDHQLIDLTSLTGKTSSSTVTAIERIDLGGQHNTLKIAMIDVLNLGETDLFRVDGKQQFMVNGKTVDTVELSNTRVAGIADGDWERQGNTTISGIAYDVYEHSTAHVELMVQQGVQLSMH